MVFLIFSHKTVFCLINKRVAQSHLGVGVECVFTISPVNYLTNLFNGRPDKIKIVVNAHDNDDGRDGRKRKEVLRIDR